MSVETIRTTDIRHSPRQLQIDFLFLDLAKCTRCRATDRSLSEALTVVAEVLKAAGIEVKVTKVHVATEELARTWRFVSSPTIRVNGADIALELRESSCGSEACTDGCGGQIACRVWVHQGQEYTEPPPELIVDAILRHVYGAPAAWTGAQPYEVPENLQRFFAGKPTSTSATLSVGEVQSAGVPAETGCCSPADQETCCDDSAKAACCDDASEQGCGCR
jgi:hypothetical protein